MEPAGRIAYLPLIEVAPAEAEPSDAIIADAPAGVSVRLAETTIVQDNPTDMPTVYFFLTFMLEGCEFELVKTWVFMQDLHQRLVAAGVHMPNFPQPEPPGDISIEARDRAGMKLVGYFQHALPNPAIYSSPIVHDALELDASERETWNNVARRAALPPPTALMALSATVAGALYITGIRIHVEQTDPAKKDSRESSLDPYVIVKWKSHDLIKTVHKDNTNTAEWPSISETIKFQMDELDTVLHIQLFDHRTILSDTLIGEIMQPLRFFCKAHANAYPDNQIALSLLGKDHKSETAKCTIECSVFCERMVSANLQSAQEASILEALKALLAVTTTPSPHRASAIDAYWTPTTFTQVQTIAQQGSGELQRSACNALLHYCASSPARAKPDVLGRLWTPTAKKAFLQALYTITPSEFAVLALGLNERGGPLEGAIADFLTLQAAPDTQESNTKTLLFFIAAGKPSSPTEWAFDRVIRHPFADIESRNAALVAAVENLVLNMQNCGTSIGCFCSIILFRAYLQNPAISNPQQMMRVINTIWKTATAEVVMLGMHVVSTLSKTVPAGLVAQSFHDLPSLHAEVIGWRLGLKVMDLVGACPTNSNTPPEVLVPNTTRPNFVIDYDIPGTNSESRFTEFSASRVHFVMRNRDNSPMVLAMAVLDLPKRCSAPTQLAAVFMCDSLPDVSLYYAYDSVTSAAQFFEIPTPPGAHPACFIDSRAPDGIQRQTRCISRYLDSAQFMYVRLINSGFPGAAVPSYIHQIQSLRFLGLNSQTLLDLNLAPHVKSDICGRLPTTLHIPARSGHERCLLLNEAMDEEPQISGLMVGGGTTGYAVMGGSRYPVRVLNGVYSPYQPVWFYRVRLYRSVIIGGRTKHRRRYKSSIWLSSHKTKRRSTFASRRIGHGIGHHSHGFGHHGIGHIGS